MTTGLACAALSRAFGAVQALDAVDFAAPRGQVTALVGPNGAGKSTLLRCVAGLDRPDSGVITWDGEPLTLAFQRHISFMAEERGLYPQDTVRQTIDFFARLRQPHGRRAPVEEILEDLELIRLANRRVGNLSLGNQQRVQVAASLVGTDHCILWDEPFSGLDVEGVAALLKTIRSRAQQGVAVVISSHQLDVLERVADRVTVIDHGHATSASLRDAPGSQRWRLTSRAGDVTTLDDSVEERGRLVAALERGEVTSITREQRTHMRDFYESVVQPA